MVSKLATWIFAGRLKIATPFGVPLYVQPLTLMLAAMMLAIDLKSGFIYLACMLSIIPHEYGHVLAGKLFGYQTKDVTMTPLGGVARIDILTMKPFEEMVITAAGPLVSLALGFAFLFLGHGFETWVGEKEPFNIFGALNLGIAIFNLMPILPMDGGRMLRSGLGLLGMKLMPATAVAFAIGCLTLLAIGTLAAFLGSFFTVAVLIFMICAGWQEVVRVKNLGRGDTSEADKAAYWVDFEKRYAAMKNTTATGGKD